MVIFFIYPLKLCKLWCLFRLLSPKNLDTKDNLMKLETRIVTTESCVHCSSPQLQGQSLYKIFACLGHYV